MKPFHRKVDLKRDTEYVLECHCMINYECDTPWARRTPYAQYRQQWFAMTSQTDEFISALRDSMADSRTLAEILETADGDTVGYLWAPFRVFDEGGFSFADIQDIYIEPAFRGAGIARYLLEYVESSARQNGAKLIRSGTGSGNIPSIKLHEGQGFYRYRHEYEKLL